MKYLFVWLLAIYLMNDEKPVIFDKMLNSKNVKKIFLCIHVELNVYKIDSKK